MRKRARGCFNDVWLVDRAAAAAVGSRNVTPSASDNLRVGKETASSKSGEKLWEVRNRVEASRCVTASSNTQTHATHCMTRTSFLDMAIGRDDCMRSSVSMM